MAKDMAQIDTVHQRGCTGRCTCAPSYRAQVWDGRAKKLHRKTFKVLAEARTWRDDVRAAVRTGTIRPATKTTVYGACLALLEGMDDGSRLDRSGKRYKPSTYRSYEQAVRVYLKDGPLASMALSDVRRVDVQDYADELRKRGLSPSSVLNKLDPVRCIFRRALQRDEIAVDPTKGLVLAAVRGRRERVADRTEATTLLDALAPWDRAFWATALYAGLRRGELRALRWSDIDLAAEPAVIHVRRNWDNKEGEVDVKTDAGYRTVPLTARLRDLIVEHGLRTRYSGNDLVFGRNATEAFPMATVRDRALRAWGWKQARNPDPGGPKLIWVKARPDALNPLTPHEARHSAASYLIEAGLNDLELTAVIGHSDSRTTKRIYGHLFSDSGATIAAKLDTYLEAA
jgi:integrase